MDSTNQSPPILSFCTGIRGLERGIERAIGHVRTICHVEIEAFVCENLVCQMEAGLLDPAPIWTDLKTFPSQVFRDKVEGITGGYPCTPFSLAGQRLGEMDPRHLWPFIRTHVNTVGPLWCFFENVDDHLTLGFDTVYKDLRALGYRVEAGVYSAAESGAPHERQRIFILAVHDSGSLRFAQKYGIQAGWNGPKSPGPETMANPQGDQPGRRPSNLRQEERRSIGELPLLNSQPGPELANTEHPGPQRSHKGRKKSQPQPGPVRGEMAHAYLRREQSGQFPGVGRIQKLDAWPAPPGPQYEWEPPRTIPREAESHLGLSFARYNFREDLLRALGNSVVEQQAEIAWKHLVLKHCQDI